VKNPYSLDRTEQELISPVQNLCREELTKLCLEALKSKTAFPHGVLRSLAELGLTGLSISEDFGGIKGGARLQAAVYDLISTQNLGPAIFISVHGMVSGLIEKFGSPEQQQAILPKLASGEWLGAFALSESDAGSDASNLSATLTETPDGSAFILNGEKCWITSAGAASLYLVFARLQGTQGKEGIAALLIQEDQQGLTIGSPEKKMGCELSPIATLTFSEAVIPKEALLGKLGDGIKIAYGGLTGGRINIAACANGLSRSALDKTVQYMKERKAFGSRLSDFQGLQFKIADMQTALDAASLLVRDAATLQELSPADSETRLRAAEAKLFATDTAMKITTEAVQLHGAMGYMKETGVEQLMRDAKMLQIVEGANEIQRGIIARGVLE